MLRQRSATAESERGASASLMVGADAPGAGGEEARRMANAMNRPPSTPITAIFAARPNSIALAEAAEALAAFGFGGGAARRVEHLGAALCRECCGQIRELLRLDGEDLITRLRCL